ncbi:MAG: BREX-2 system phosphatase PglZ [Deltaproteobacteria bacterium]|nr:BREX-2 system phosphatase PglZ [Deltaproteobacteria bacterium]
MSVGPQHLSHADIQGQLKELYGQERRHHLFALYGTGEAGTLELAELGKFEVMPVRSELELRERMPPIDDEDQRIVFLVPWARDIPLDISGRFALQGRVRRVGREAQLKRLFGVVEAEPQLPRSPLLEYLLRPENPHRYPVSESRLTADRMWSTWLAVDFGYPSDGSLALDALLGWAAVDSGASFSAAMAHPKATGVVDALLEHLRRSLGPAGALVVRRWEAGAGAAVLEYALIFEALFSGSDPEARLWMRTVVRKELGVTNEDDVEPAIAALAASAGSALRVLESKLGVGGARNTLQRADARIDDAVVRRAAAGSTRLPSAWIAQLNALGGELKAGAASPTREGVEAAKKRLRALEAHASFKDEESEHRVRRGEMALRLLAWLAVRPDQKLTPGLQPFADAELLGRWYAEEGGFIDRARRAARGVTESAFGAGVQAVVEAADAVRTELDRRFARALGAWVEAGRPSNQVLPIDDVTKRVVARFLDENPERKLLVLLLDGMAWAQAVELLESLSARAVPWGPIGWHASKQGRVGDGFYPVMFANLPSVTEVSRSAFFAGKAMAVGKSHDTQKDPERWKANPSITKFFSDLDSPPLLLRSESHTKAGAASPEALTMVGDAARRVVGIVVNAIDDSLKSNPAVRHRWGVENIASLPDLIEKARESGRAVLMAGDHGHVPADRMEFKGAPQGGARWRPWTAEDEVVAEYEVAMRAGEGVWAPKDSRGVILLADDASRYGTATHAGEHGGATLAEVVTPCLIIASDDLQLGLVQPDAGLNVRAPYVPSWWYFDLGEEGSGLPEVAPVGKKPGKKPKDDEEKQPLLPNVHPSSPPSGRSSRPPKPPESPFARSKVLAVQAHPDLRPQVVRAVDYLMMRHGMATTAQFATEMGELTRRVGGLVAKLSEVLNLDGYQVLSFDPQTSQVRLDIGKLRMLFEVKE